MNPFIQALQTYWPTIVAALSGLIIGFVAYLKARLTYKTTIAEKDTANAELQKVIIQGSYVICPDCGKKILIQSTTIHTGGIENEK